MKKQFKKYKQVVRKSSPNRKRPTHQQRKKIIPKPYLRLTKPSENPIISPKPENEWEAWQTFNPGAILLEDKIHFLYRAIGQDGISRLGYASSGDGFVIDERLSYPVYEHYYSWVSPLSVFSFASGGSFGGCEDSRLTRVGGENVLYMTYTACSDGLRVGLTSIKAGDFLNKNWKWRTPKIISPPGEIHKNWVIFPEKIRGRYAILHSISPEILVAYLDSLEFENGHYLESFHGSEPRNGCWDSQTRGAGAPPIKTKYGWLVFYHAIDCQDPAKYKAGAMLLDLDDPTKVLYRSSHSVLEPDQWYENRGFKPGIVYVSGAVVKNGELLVYYGGADNYVCVASANLEEFLQELKKDLKPGLQKRILKTLS